MAAARPGLDSVAGGPAADLSTALDPGWATELEPVALSQPPQLPHACARQ